MDDASSARAEAEALMQELLADTSRPPDLIASDNVAVRRRDSEKQDESRKEQLEVRREDSERQRCDLADGGALVTDMQRRNDKKRRDRELPSEVRSLRHKVDKLTECNKKTTGELEQERRRFHKRRAELKEAAEKAKADFLRSAASLRREADEHRAGVERCDEVISVKEPEIAELRARLDEVEREHRRRRAELEQAREERLRPLRDEHELVRSRQGRRAAPSQSHAALPQPARYSSGESSANGNALDDM